MKYRVRSVVITMVIIMITLTVSYQTATARALFLEIDQPRTGIVTKMIDTEAIEVMYYSTLSSVPTLEKIRLVGVNSLGDNTSFEYAKNQLLGKTVFIVYDTNLATSDGFVPAYVYTSLAQSFNETLLQEGYGIFETADTNALYKADLLKAEKIGQNQELNLWQTQSSPVNKININLASLETLKNHLSVSSEEASAIITYRTYNPINDIAELGFVLPAFTREVVQTTGRSIHVITDMNSASIYELESLFSTFSSLDNAYTVNNYRIFQPINTFSEIQSLLTLSASEYTKLNTYATVKANPNIFEEDSKVKANINTATAAEIVKASSITQTQADKIISLRTTYPFVFRSLSELYQEYPSIFTTSLTYYSDDLTTITDVNTANLDELKSLFSRNIPTDSLKTKLAQKIIDYRPFYSYAVLEETVGFTFYNYIKPYITIEDLETSLDAPMNINTAAKTSMISYLGLSTSQATTLQNRSSKFYVPGDVFFANSANGKKISLYTNINTADVTELMLMNTSMTRALAEKIIEYRIELPFYSKEDLYTFFTQEGHEGIYTIIKDYVVYY